MPLRISTSVYILGAELYKGKEVLVRLVICGGVHGVGKTTLMNRVAAILGEKCVRFDPGELFMEHLYRQKDKTGPEIEEMVVEQLVKSVLSSPLVLSNWHYAVWQPQGYTTQVSMERWERIVRETSCAQIVLALVAASPEEILTRREKDCGIRRRKLNLDAVREELEQTDRSYKEHYRLARLFREPERAVIDNSSLEAATDALLALCHHV